MGDGTRENPYTREDVLRLIKENGGKAEGLDLSGKAFEQGIDLRGLNLKGIILNRTFFPTTTPRIDDFRATMRPAQLQGANLTQAQLQKADLALAQLRGAILESAQLQEAHLLSANLQGASLRWAQLQGASLYEAQLQGADLHGAKLEGASLHEAKFSPNTRLEGAYWEKYILGEEKEGIFDWAVDAYRQLKTWYTNAGMYEIAGEFFFREMTARRKEFWWGRIKGKPFSQLFHPFKPKELLRAIFPRKPLHWAWSILLNMFCGYGERPIRVIGWAASVTLGLALVYFLIGSVWEWSAFWNSLYFSAVSFTALGYGEWVKETMTNDWIRGIGAFESFIGVFSIALFLVTFVRKMTR